MKKLLVFFLFVSFSVTAQFTAVDKKVRAYPAFKSVEKLANQIQSDFTSDIDKARALYVWLSLNIEYDLDEYYNPTQKNTSFSYRNEAEKQLKLSQIENELINQTLSQKKSVCEGYAQVFKKVSDLLGLESYVIDGYARSLVNEIGIVPATTNHSWNAIRVNNRWLLMDTTWGAGFVVNGKWRKSFSDYFFDIDHQKIQISHYPTDKKWIAIFNYKTLQEFVNQPIYNVSFLQTATKLVSPTKGTIDLKKNENIILKFKNFPDDKTILYAFKNQQYGEKPIITKENDKTILTIKNPNKNTVLRIFIDLRVALEYLVYVN